MITSKQLVDYAQNLLKNKAAYWYGTFGQVASTSLYNSKKAQYPGHYTAARASGYRADIAAKKTVVDCIGVMKGAAWTDGGQYAPKYATNGCPDKSADSMFKWCKSEGMEQGKMAALPEVPGLFLHLAGHAAVYIGDGWAIEAKGYSDDVLKSKVAGRGWTGWTYLPFVDYEDGGDHPEPEHEFGTRTLQMGDEGEDVAQLQAFLIGAGYDCGDHGDGGVDGEFGKDTQSALIAWQYDNGLPETGVCDEDDFAAIEAATNPDPDDDPDDGDDEPEVQRYVTVTSGNTVNIRSAPSTSGAKLGIAYLGDSFEYAGETSDNGWYEILYNGSDAWITGQYTTLADEPVPVPDPDPDDGDAIIVDLSQHNGMRNSKNDWSKIAKNVDLLILRCGVTRTETAPIGIGKDDDYAYIAKKCAEFGIPFGVYYYGKVKTAAEARKEADKAWDVASPYDPLFYCYDVEEGRLTDKCIIAWADQIRARGATKVGMYIGHNYYQAHKATVKAFDFIWIPRYGKNTGKYDPKYQPVYPCDLHQYTSKGKVDGIADGTVDLNRLTGTKPLSWFLAR